MSYRFEQSSDAGWTRPQMVYQCTSFNLFCHSLCALNDYIALQSFNKMSEQSRQKSDMATLNPQASTNHLQELNDNIKSGNVGQKYSVFSQQCTPSKI